MSALYERIENLCKEHGTNITQMCKSAGVQRSVLSDYKSGRNKTISFSNLQKIADYFGMSVDELVNGETKKAPVAEPAEDIEFIRLQRAYRKMDSDTRSKAINTLRAAFEEFFSDDYIDDDTEE